jgi:hypothetical protein
MACVCQLPPEILDENESHPYITEGIGEDILPKNVDFHWLMFWKGNR